MSAETQFYLLAVPAVIVLGLSKGGFTGLSSLAMPMLSLVISPIWAAAIVLPVLIVQDWVSVCSTGQLMPNPDDRVARFPCARYR